MKSYLILSDYETYFTVITKKQGVHRIITMKRITNEKKSRISSVRLLPNKGKYVDSDESLSLSVESIYNIFRDPAVGTKRPS